MTTQSLQSAQHHAQGTHGHNVSSILSALPDGSVITKMGPASWKVALNASGTQTGMGNSIAHAIRSIGSLREVLETGGVQTVSPSGGVILPDSPPAQSTTPSLVPDGALIDVSPPVPNGISAAATPPSEQDQGTADLDPGALNTDLGTAPAA